MVKGSAACMTAVLHFHREKKTSSSNLHSFNAAGNTPGVIQRGTWGVGGKEREKKSCNAAVIVHLNAEL